jgi:hypothetical protein
MNSDCPKDELLPKKEETKKEPIKVNVSDLVPQIIKINEKNTTLIVTGNKIKEQVFTLGIGTYVVNEVMKTLYTFNGKKYDKHSVAPMIVADRIF